MDAYKGWNGAGIFAPEKINDYGERISYDGNGNILNYLRNCNAGQLAMDNLQYAYSKDANGNIINNKLRHVKDAVRNANHAAVDIDKQSDENYSYDAIGNLIQDKAERIENIEWNVYANTKIYNRASFLRKSSLRLVDTSISEPSANNTEPPLPL